MKHHIQNKRLARYLPALVALVIGVGVGMTIKSQPASLYLATAAEKEIAKQEITRLYVAASSTNCSDPSDPIRPQDRIAVFNTYLQINGYANRAVIRGCNNTDRLLAKTQYGEWVATNINLTLDARVNAKWQKECLIQDITVTDTVVRPENTSIDTLNFEECQKIKKL